MSDEISKDEIKEKDEKKLFIKRGILALSITLVLLFLWFCRVAYMPIGVIFTPVIIFLFVYGAVAIHYVFSCVNNFTFQFDSSGAVMILTIVFIVLKKTGVIDWSWFWVLSPMWIGFCLIAVIFLGLCIVAWWKGL